MKSDEMSAILTAAVKGSKLETILAEKRDALVAEATKGKFKSFNELKSAKAAQILKEKAAVEAEQEEAKRKERLAKAEAEMKAAKAAVESAKPKSAK